ncbi:MAG: O-methyltransferase [Bacteroidota bacterium]
MELKERILLDYCAAHTTLPHPILYELERMTHLRTLAPQMASGPVQGSLLYMLSSLLQAKSILEIGTFTGYATICLAMGLAPNGRVYTIEANAELEYLIREYLRKAKLEEQVQLYMGKAEEIVPTLEGSFDLVFIDAGKQQYAEHYDLIIDRVRSGGLILADNVLWSKKVIQKQYDLDTQLLHQFNQKIQEDERVENVLLPIRDGLIVVRKR